MMRNIILSISLFLVGAITAQTSSSEILDQTSSYVPYQDTLLILRTKTIRTTEAEGVNDTLVTYGEITDSAGLEQQLIVLAEQISNTYLNTANTKAAILRKSMPMKFFLQDYIRAKTELELLGTSLDSILVGRYSRFFIGTWRVFLNSGAETVQVIKHPTRSDILRVESDKITGAITFYGRYHIRLTLTRGAGPNGQSYFLNWNGESEDNPVFEVLTNNLPAAVTPREPFRIRKLR